MTPFKRFHRLRKNDAMRRLLAETHLHKDQLVMPIFINEGLDSPQPIQSLPGISQQSPSSLIDEVGDMHRLGIQSVILFGIPNNKDAVGSNAHHPDGVVQNAIHAIKTTYPEMIVIADCCLCEYTDHGHCGIMSDMKLDNDSTLKRLSDIALSYADAGCDIIAPSGMMDGMVDTIRHALDRRGYLGVNIMSYAIKYASAFYGPFRDAAGSTDTFKGDRKHHQMNPPQIREALHEAAADIDEGADIIMIKPAMMYLDIIRQITDAYAVPTAAYQVSGEYAMLLHAEAAGIVPKDTAMLESLMAIRRSGADIIISYAVKALCDAGIL